MEQYWMPKSLDFKNLRYVLKHYEAEEIFIRFMGSASGNVQLSENLEGKLFDFKKVQDGMDILIDGEKRFRFSLKDYHKSYTKGFSVAYNRFYPDGRIVMLGGGKNPNDPNLPEPKSSVFRWCPNIQLFELTFKGKIPLKFHSWWNETNGWIYWTIDKSR